MILYYFTRDKLKKMVEPCGPDRDDGNGDGPGVAKRAKRECKYQKEWQKSGITSSKRGAAFAHCECCSTDFNIGHGGLNDVRKHL